MSASRLLCEQHGKAHESYLQGRRGDFPDGTGALLMQGKLSTGPWYCDDCQVRTVLKKGNLAYFITFYRADEMAEVARCVDAAGLIDAPLSEFWDVEYLRRYFTLSGRESMNAYGPDWPKAIPCRVVDEEEDEYQTEGMGIRTLFKNWRRHLP